MKYPKPGDTIALTIGVSWPTPNHIFRAAEAIDAISIPKLGDILRAVGEALDTPLDVPQDPWDAAEEGEWWAFEVDGWYGEPRLYKRTPKGWVHAGAAHKSLGDRTITAGKKIWPEAPVY